MVSIDISKGKGTACFLKPYVGEILGPRIIAEIGDVRRFHSASALVAYAIRFIHGRKT